jgi:hypothetical protein
MNALLLLFYVPFKGKKKTGTHESNI